MVTKTPDPDNVRLVLVLDQPTAQNAGVFLALVGTPPMPVLCTGDGDALPYTGPRVVFPSQLAPFDDDRLRGWALKIVAFLFHVRPQAADYCGLLLAAKAIGRRIGLVVAPQFNRQRKDLAGVYELYAQEVGRG